MARVGILGGTFNPPHVGHLICAQEALDQLGLDRVLLMPVFAPPHKALQADPGPDARVEMCRLAVAGDERFEVSTLEVERGGASYTVETLRALRAAAPDDEFTFIVGADMAAALGSWREPREILQLATLAVAGRGETARADVERAVAPLHDGTRLAFFDMPRIDVSSSMLRARIAGGHPVSFYIPEGVVARIAARRWYRDAAAAAPLATEAHG